ncbi:MAG: T9SS type A sorting domain-containing protein [Bacteroidia bacterium]
MKINFTRNLFVLAVAILSSCFSAMALPGIQYTLTAGSAAFTTIGAPATTATSGTPMAANVDESLLGPFSPTGFAVNYGGIRYTSFYLSSNGFISFQNPGGALPNNDMSTAPSTLVAPLWDDLKTGGAGRVAWIYSLGTLTVEWNNMLWGNTALAASINFQAKIVTASGNIVFTYQQLAGAVDVTSSLGASIGLSGYCPGDYYSQNNSSVQTLGTTYGKNVLFNTISTKPTNNQTFTWAPVAGVPANDTCGTATTLTFNPGAITTLTNQTLVMTRQVNMASANPAKPAAWTAQSFSNDVWYSVTKPVGITSFELLINNTCPATFTTAMAVYTGTCGAFTLVAADEASNGSSPGNPYILISGRPCNVAETFLVRVEGDQDTWVGNFDIQLRPPGTTCATANDITCWFYDAANPSPGSYNTTVAPTNWTMNNAGFNNNFDTNNVNPRNLATSGSDYLFSFTPTASGCYDISLFNTTVNTNPGIFIYTACPTAGSVVAYNIGAGGSAININSLTLGAGFTYYIMIDNDTAAAASTPFSFSITPSALGAPPNDNCANPPASVAITPITGSSCTGSTNWTVACATPSAAGTIINPGCAGFVDGVTGDVWFTMTSVSNQPHSISVQPGTSGTIATDLGMAVYTGTCGALSTLIGCDDNSAGSNMPAITVVPPAAGTVYYVRVWSNTGATPGTFRICAISGCTPANDLCSGAVPLTMGVSATYQTNVCASGTGASDTGPATCWDAGSLNTVWYTIVTTGTTLKIRTRLRSLTDSQISLYSGTCGSLVQVACNDNFTLCSSGGGRNSDLNVTGLTAGATYYIRVDGRNAATGTFDIMAIDGASSFPPIPDQDCDLATPVCTANTTVADPGFTGSGNICDLQTGTCLASAEASGVWYTFSTTSTGPGSNLQFVVTPNNGFSDYDFQMWETTGLGSYCSLIQTNPTSGTFPFRTCNYSAVGTTGLSSSAGGGFNPPYTLSATAGTVQTFVLLVSHFGNYSGGSTSGFTLNFPGTTPLNIGAPNVQYWRPDAASSTWAPGTLSSNWDPSCITTMGTCAGGPSTCVIQGGPNQPIIAANTSVKNLIINAGATLTINAGITLSICGDLTNNGTLNCLAGSTVQFIGNGNQQMSGNLTGTSAFWNLTMSKSGGTLTPNVNVDIKGNFTLNTASPTGQWIPNGKHFKVAGNWTNNGGTTTHGIATNSTYEFNGAAPQTFTNLVSSVDLYNVTMNQSVVSTLNLAVGAFNDLNILDSLTLTSGKIVTGAQKVYHKTNTSPLLITLGNANSYVVGNLRRALNTGLQTWHFPVGSNQFYNLAEIQYTASPVTAYDVTGSFTLNSPWVPIAGPTALECIINTYDVLNLFDQGYWTFIPHTGSGTGTYTMKLHNNGETNNTGMGWTVAKYISGAWGLQGTCYIPSTAPNTQRTGMSGFGTVGVGTDFATAQSQTPLPIELISFTAEPDGEGVMCDWVTASESNNSYFEILRSYNGESFEVVNANNPIAGCGLGVCNETRYYSYLDKDHCEGVQYYKLRQVDIDGNYSTSKPVAVNCKGKLDELSVYPNPAYTDLTYTFFESGDGQITVEFIDVLGKIVKQENILVHKGYNTIKSGLEELAGGIYYIKLKREGDTQEISRQAKFLKK